MRIITLILSLFFSAELIAQTNWGVPSPDVGSNISKRRVWYTPATNQGTWFKYPNGSGSQNMNNFPISLLEYKPRDSVHSNGTLKKQPAFIHFHGIGERGGISVAPYFDTTLANTSGSNGTEWLDDVYQLPPMTHLQQMNGSTSERALIGKKHTDPMGKFTDGLAEFWVFAPQQWGQGSGAGQWGFNRWAPHYLRVILDKITSDPYYYNRIDTNRIYIGGQSLGGGGAITMLTVADLRKRIAGAIIVCPGYRFNGTNSAITQAQYQEIAESGIPIWVIRANDDDAGTLEIEGPAFVDAVNAYHPRVPVKYTVFSNGEMAEHGLSDPHHSWHPAFNPAHQETTDIWTTNNNGNVLFTPANGINWMSPYSWLLQFSKHGREN
jgi:hypothetical protein